jgi:hypothetical protein
LEDHRFASLIAETIAAKIDRAGLPAERVLEEIRRLASFDVRRFYDANGNLKAITDLKDGPLSPGLRWCAHPPISRVATKLY